MAIEVDGKAVSFGNRTKVGALVRAAAAPVLKQSMQRHTDRREAGWFRCGSHVCRVLRPGASEPTDEGGRSARGPHLHGGC